MSNTTPFPKPPASGTIDADYIERLIDHVGRDLVFARARGLGWSGSPPLWVWNQICVDLLAERAPPPIVAGTVH